MSYTWVVEDVGCAQHTLTPTSEAGAEKKDKTIHSGQRNRAGFLSIRAARPDRVRLATLQAAFKLCNDCFLFLTCREGKPCVPRPPPTQPLPSPPPPTPPPAPLLHLVRARQALGARPRRSCCCRGSGNAHMHTGHGTDDAFHTRFESRGAGGHTKYKICHKLLIKSIPRNTPD
ncbi:hypothetical protein E2C01_054186 [Portunus trituberculatus]|uniref:Uncharacterized protein n=1 Tax=Portunus trituberculatus TaxID=210409 RepID=A0A5B7GT19_PORTR|nr:hypothetical protein [Portunus trituberculatus]